MKKIGKGFFVFFAISICGIFILSFGLFSVGKYIYNYKTYEETEASVVGYSTSDKGKRMNVKFIANEKEYIVSTNFTDEELKLDDKIIVKYDKNDPTKYIMGNERIDFSRTIVGLLISIMGIVGMVLSYPNKKEK